MSAPPFRLLLLEDNPGDVRLVQLALAEEAPGEFAVTTAERLADAQMRLQTEHFDVVLCDLGLPDSAGLETVKEIIARAPAVPLVVLTGTHDIHLGRKAIDLGAQDYMVKGDTKPSLARTIRYAIDRKRLENDLRTLNEALEQRVAERTVELHERVKELQCIYGITQIGLNSQKSLNEVFEESVRLIPLGWYYPEITCGRIVWEERVFATDNYKQTPWQLSADITIRGEKVGVVDVCYLEERPERDQGPFLKEERSLIASLASNFSSLIARKMAQDSLRKSESRMANAMDATSDGLWERDITSGRGYSSPAYYRMLGYEENEFASNSEVWRDLIHPEDRERTLAANQDCIDNKVQSFFAEFRMRAKDGSWRWILARGKAVERDSSGKALTMIGTHVDVTERKRAEQQEREAAIRIEHAMFGTIDAVSRMMNLRDPYTSGHSRRVGELSADIAAEMGLGVDMQRALRVAGGLHDVGKITVPAELLSKPSKLNAMEYALIQHHAQQGYEVLKDIDFPWPLAEVARQHHERIDGSGYPRGLKGDEIILEARILSVADVVEAMYSHRPYRPGLGIDKALAEIERGRGTAYDANAVDACVRLFREKGYAIPE